MLLILVLFDSLWRCSMRRLGTLRYRMVTNSSAAVGWIATQLSKSALVAPILIATAKPARYDAFVPKDMRFVFVYVVVQQCQQTREAGRGNSGMKQRRE